MARKPKKQPRTQAPYKDPRRSFDEARRTAASQEDPIERAIALRGLDVNERIGRTPGHSAQWERAYRGETAAVAKELRKQRRSGNRIR